MIQEVFIAHKPFSFAEVNGINSYFVLMALTRDIYPLQKINEMEI